MNTKGTRKQNTFTQSDLTNAWTDYTAYSMA